MIGYLCRYPWSKKQQSLFEEIIKDIQDKYRDESEKILMDLVEQQKVFESLRVDI